MCLKKQIGILQTHNSIIIVKCTPLKYCSNIFGDKWNGIDKDKKIKLSGTKTKITTILKDYPDTYFRYMKETTLIYKKKVMEGWPSG